MPQLAEITEVSQIERVHAPTREQFETEFVARRRPCILTGIADRWPAFRRWTPEYLKEVAGDARVTAHYDESGNFHRWYSTQPGERPERTMPFGELLDLLAKEPPDPRYYMTEHDLDLISERLLGDLDGSQLCPDRKHKGVASGPCLFVGRKTSMPLHYHATTEAIMCQLREPKQVTLYGPEQTPYLYPRPWYSQAYVFSKIRCRRYDDIDFERFPRARQARPLTFVVQPGEILFIPVHWWHVTETFGGLQVSVTYFWASERGRWHYPQPGMQVNLHEAMRKSGLALRDLKSWMTGRIRRG